METVEQEVAYKGNLGQVSNLMVSEGHKTGIWDWGDLKLLQSYCVLSFFAKDSSSS